MPSPTEVNRRSTTRRRITFPVIEVFGPTVQGEGPDAGRPAYFIRFGGCDFRCSWCDSMYAVDPALVREEAESLDATAVAERVLALDAGPSLVVLSGGNPALLQLDSVVERLRGLGFEVAVETQGSVWRAWLAEVDRLVVSPKPPSSGMDSPKNRDGFSAFMDAAERASVDTVLKIVVFDERDFEYAEGVADTYPEVPFHLSAGTDVGREEAATVEAVLTRFRWLCERTACSVTLQRARVLPQLHVLAWGTARGV